MGFQPMSCVPARSGVLRRTQERSVLVFFASATQPDVNKTQTFPLTPPAPSAMLVKRPGQHWFAGSTFMSTGGFLMSTFNSSHPPPPPPTLSPPPMPKKGPRCPPPADAPKPLPPSPSPIPDSNAPVDL